MPATCDSTDTVLNAWPVPIARNSTGNELRSTLLTTTGTADFSAVLSSDPLPPDACAAPLLSVQPRRASREISEMGAAILRTLTISLSIRSREDSSNVNDGRVECWRRVPAIACPHTPWLTSAHSHKSAAATPTRSIGQGAASLLSPKVDLPMVGFQLDVKR